MKRYVFLSFVFLGWAFYEASGGADFEPAPHDRVAETSSAAVEAAEADPVEGYTYTEISTEAGIVSTRSSEPAPSPEPAPQPIPEPITASLVSEPEPTPEPERVALTPAPEELERMAEVEEVPRDMREVDGSRVNMRSGPGTRYSVLVTLPGGTRVEVLREPGNGWAKLKVEETGRIGWMSSRLLREAD